MNIHKIRIVLIMVSLVALAISGVIHYRTLNPSVPFDQDKWLQANSQQVGNYRQVIVNEILRHRIMKGDLRPQVRSLLGKPSPNPGGDEPSEDVYDLGPYPSRMDSSYLYIQYDKEERVMKMGLFEG